MESLREEEIENRDALNLPRLREIMSKYSLNSSHHIKKSDRVILQLDHNKRG